MNDRTWKQVFLLLFIFLGFSSSKAIYAVEAHHFFNANLLKQNEFQISILGNLKYGQSDNLEVGTQLATNFVLPNFYVKHKMFDFESQKTAFVGHALVGDENFFGIYGVVHSYAFDPEQSANLGFYIGQVNKLPNISNLAQKDDVESIKQLNLSIGYDLDISSSIYFNANVFYPFYRLVDVENNSADVSLQQNLPLSISSADRDLYSRIVTFSTVTFRFNNVLLECGLVGISTDVYPYLNLFWRLEDGFF